MFFRKAQFQRDGHARCNLLLTRTLLRHGTDLSPVGRRALTGIIHHSLYARVIADNRHRRGLQVQKCPLSIRGDVINSSRDRPGDASVSPPTVSPVSITSCCMVFC